MPNSESRPVATSIRVDQEHTLEMRADMATKTAEVENVTTGEMYTGGGGDSDFSTAEITFIIDSTDPNGGGSYSVAFLTNDELAVGENINFPDVTATIVLYKGSYIGSIAAMGLSVSGNIELSDIRSEDGWTFADMKITGDCTIHYIGEQSN